MSCNLKSKVRRAARFERRQRRRRLVDVVLFRRKRGVVYFKRTQRRLLPGVTATRLIAKIDVTWEPE